MPDDVRSTPLTEALVRHLQETFAQYPEGEVLLPDADEEFVRWLAGVPGFPGPLPVGICPRSALEGRLAHAVEEAHDAAGVLVVCGVDGEDGETAPDPVAVPADVDLVVVRRSSEIAGAVLEALAGDVPLVVDVRLTAEDGAALLGARP